MDSARFALLPVLGLASLGALPLAACGGEDGPATRTSTEHSVSSKGSTPAVQRLGGRRTLRIAVRNRGERSIPNVTVTLTGLTRDVEISDSGSGRGVDPRRPVWIVDRPPIGSSTDYADTWSLGRLAPRRTATFTWRLTAATPGRWGLRWRVSGGIDAPGTVTSADDTATGRLTVTIPDRPRAVGR